MAARRASSRWSWAGLRIHYPKSIPFMTRFVKRHEKEKEKVFLGFQLSLFGSSFHEAKKEGDLTRKKVFLD
jgi:hypothetical protein